MVSPSSLELFQDCTQDDLQNDRLLIPKYADGEKCDLHSGPSTNSARSNFISRSRDSGRECLKLH